MAKQRSGWAYRQRFGMPLWREGYFERTLRPHEDPRAVARYVINNPIRAGLAATPADYPHLGSDVWSLTDLIQSLI
jgi:hypothetical protein